jgi:diadenosine tetraphosphatase ApaH/serine/threonine PP2A family protein phosphatase
VPDANVLLCHGSPVRIEEFEYIFAPEQARECLPILDQLADITFIGHSHLCKVFALKPGEVREQPARDFQLQSGYKYVVSVGSVGQPRDYDNRASYTVFDTETLTLEFKRIEYDIDTAASKIFAANLERNFGHRLFIGV